MEYCFWEAFSLRSFVLLLEGNIVHTFFKKGTCSTKRLRFPASFFCLKQAKSYSVQIVCI